jgi:3-oxoacyl-[acyl-carrier-protein] synthase-3
MKFEGFDIKAVTCGLPSARVDNLNNPLSSHENSLKFVNSTGIRYRYVSQSERNEQIAEWSELCSRTVKNVGWEYSEIDVCLVVTQTHLNSIPGVSNRLHSELKLNANCICLDVNAGCSGYVYGMYILMTLMKGLCMNEGKALLCVGDYSSQIIDKEDSATNSLFSDVLSVTAIKMSPELKREFEFHLLTKGESWEAIRSEISEKSRREVLSLDGIDVFQNSVALVPESIKNVFFQQSEFPYLVMHQANKIINESIVRRLGWPVEKVIESLSEFGNSGSASIPLTLAVNKLTGAQAILCGFGVGFSVSTVKLELSNEVKYELHYF